METPEVDRIRVCIDRYMEGFSTQEELRMLKNYFNGNREIPADLLPYREMFAIIDREPVRLSDDAVRRLSRIGDNRNGVRLWPWIAAACAVILLLVLTTPPKGGSVVQPQFAEAEAPQPSAPAPEISDTVREDALRENAVLDKSTQTDTVTGKISPKDVMHFALPQALKTAVAETDNEPELEMPQEIQPEIRQEMIHQDMYAYQLCDTTGIGQKLMALEMEFQRQDSLYILNLLNLDEEATLAANSIYVSLLQ
ncbi:MAG: hypothetical protein MJY77_08025 [Bacteroidaceae bacterium]|nr:hypothetical protein [Bacteroidaceae bacterium]